MTRWAVLAVTAAAVVCVTSHPARAEQSSYVPGIKVLLEVRTPQGDLRTFQLPGAPPTYWQQDMPVVQGDKLTVSPMIATGGAELGQVTVRLDNEPLAATSEAPWRAEVETAKLTPGYHSVEVWAGIKPPNAGEGSTAIAFLVVPPSDPLLQSGQAAAGPPVSDEEKLACAIRALDPKVDKQLLTTSTAKVAGPTLFHVTAGPAAKEFFYSLSREGRVTYTSPLLPVQTSVLLTPLEDQGPGQEPGEVILTMRVGDGAGRFGPPAWVTVGIVAPEATK
ncbi:MAG TPA: hypothetical protein VM221_11075 [Armatimonadota bacterium]|nr:hypothetical protein [Armatimonadota bacterium]